MHDLTGMIPGELFFGRKFLTALKRMSLFEEDWSERQIADSDELFMEAQEYVQKAQTRRAK